jgi:hypothetical protein
VNVELIAVRVLPVLSLVVLSACAFPQKPSDWRKTSLSPLEFANRIDKGLYSLKGALGQATFRAKFFDGGNGNGRLVNRIRDRKNFRVEFVRIDAKARDPFVGQIMVSTNGSINLVTSTVGTKPLVSGQNPGFVSTAANPVQVFPEHFTQLMFEHYVTGKSRFAPFVSSLLKGDGGYSVKMESRTMQSGGRSLPQVRLFASRTAVAAKKLGPATIEIVTDTNMWLPLQIRVNMTNLKKQNAQFDWQSMWSGPFRFDDKWFKKPGKSA